MPSRQSAGFHNLGWILFDGVAESLHSSHDIFNLDNSTRVQAIYVRYECLRSLAPLINEYHVVDNNNSDTHCSQATRSEWSIFLDWEVANRKLQCRR